MKKAFSTVQNSRNGANALRSVGAAVFAGILVSAVAIVLAIAGPAEFAAGRLWFAIPTGIAGGALAGLIVRYGVNGLMSPPGMFISGCIVFLSMAPLIAPANSYGNVVYRHESASARVAAIYALGLVSFLVGSILAPGLVPASGKSGYLTGRGLTRRLRRRLVIGVVIVGACCVMVVMAASRTWGLPVLAFVTESQYGAGAPSETLEHVNSEGMGFVLYQIVRYLVQALAILAAVLAGAGKRVFARVFGTLVFLGAAFYTFAVGTRFVFGYVALGGCLVYLTEFARRRGMWPRLTISKKVVWAALVLAAGIGQMFEVRSSGGLRQFLEHPTIMSAEYFFESGIDQSLYLDEMLETVPAKRPYVGGASFASTFVLFVPRVWWPEKPRSGWAYMEGYTSRISNPNVSYTLFGELYLNFGVMGIAGGSALIGYLTAWWWRVGVLRGGRSPLVSVLYWMSVPGFGFLVRGDFQTAVGGILFPGIVVATLLAWAARPGAIPAERHVERTVMLPMAREVE